MSIKSLMKLLLPKKILDFTRPYYKQYTNFKTLAKEYGQLETMKQWSCIDKNKNPIPWYTYPAIEYLSNLDFSQKTILEWGGGNSSLFWAKRCKEVFTIEINPMWFEQIKRKSLNNQKIFLKTQLDQSQMDESYVTYPKTLGRKFDVIVIDGSERNACSHAALDLLNNQSKEGAMIILDNSDWFPNTSKFLKESGLLQVDFHGFAPINEYTHTTSIFFTRNFVFPILHSRQPHYSQAAICSIED